MGSRHDIGVVFGGHLHSDELGRVAWADGGGETIYTCQNPVYFGAGGESDEYPAYRLVEIRNGRVDSMSYLDGVSSFPFYDGSVPMGITDIDLLQLPALQFQSETGEDGGFHANIDISNYLASPMLLEGLVIEAPQAAVSGFEVEGGEIYQVLPIAGKPGRVLLYIRVSLAAGDPGPSAEIPGEPAVTRIVVRTLN
ncbi:MAG: hypothetical protein A2W01_01680 [Candidatus Solincola sediminis]|nr:MAG: hypothetical protein A2W01_01680 [Candidatus Solincola sediminis]